LQFYGTFMYTSPKTCYVSAFTLNLCVNKCKINLNIGYILIKTYFLFLSEVNYNWIHNECEQLIHSSVFTDCDYIHHFHYNIFLRTTVPYVDVFWSIMHLNLLFIFLFVYHLRVLFCNIFVPSLLIKFVQPFLSP